MNHITAVVNVGRQPDGLRYSASGTAILKFSVADTIGKDENKKTSWMDVVCFKDLAESVAEHIGKGDRIVVTGRLQVDEYEKKDGTKGKRVEILADNIAKVVRGRRDPLADVKSALNATEVDEEELF